MEKRWVATVHLDTLEVEYDPSFKFRCVENCGLCCNNLEIPLRDEDIERIEELGYNTWEFVDYEKAFYRGNRFLGYALKKNPLNDSCIFFDPETRKCKIYDHRPLACRLYPFIFIRDENLMEIYVKGDRFCPGIGHPEGEPLTRKFLMGEYGDLLIVHRREIVNSRR